MTEMTACNCCSVPAGSNLKKGFIMKQDFLQLQLVCAIDTLEMYSNSIIYNNQYRGVTPCRPYLNEQTGEVRCKIKVNINTYHGSEIISHSKFKEVYDELQNNMGGDDHILSRTDFRFDLYKNNSFRSGYKICRLLSLLLGFDLNLNNRYESIDPLTLEPLNIVAKSKYYEIEYYNKSLQEPNSGVQARLELRTKNLIKSKKDISQCLLEWLKRLDDLPSSYQEFQNITNNYLYEKWREEKGKKVKSANEFVRKYESSIYSKKQLIHFFELIGAENPVNAAGNCRRNNKFELISPNDLVRFCNNLRKSAKNYLYYDCGNQAKNVS